jgi:hypothetical protein
MGPLYQELADQPIATLGNAELRSLRAGVARRGVSPKYAPTARPFGKRAGSSIVRTNASAVSAPTPVTWRSRAVAGYRVASCSTWRS